MRDSEQVFLTRGDIVAIGAGVVIGIVGSVFGFFRGRAAVNVRPNLADVGFIDAALTNHGADWLYYHYPVIATLLAVAFFSLVLFAGRRWFWS